MTDKKTSNNEMMAWAIVWLVVATALWSTVMIVNKLTEPCPTTTVNCPHVPFATTDDMQQLSSELVECQTLLRGGQ